MLREMQVGFDAAAWKRERETVLEDLRVFQCSQVEQPQHSVLDILSVFSLASDAQGQPGVGGGEGNKKNNRPKTLALLLLIDSCHAQARSAQGCQSRMPGSENATCQWFLAVDCTFYSTN